VFERAALIVAAMRPRFLHIMRTVIALFVALLGFGVTVAWGAEPVPHPRAAASQVDVKPKSRPPSRAAQKTLPTPDFDKRARETPSVICACVRDGLRA